MTIGATQDNAWGAEFVATGSGFLMLSDPVRIDRAPGSFCSPVLMFMTAVSCSQLFRQALTTAYLQMRLRYTQRKWGSLFQEYTLVRSLKPGN